MTNLSTQDKLQELIAKAIDGGWNPLGQSNVGAHIETGAYPVSMLPEYCVCLGNNGQPPYDSITSTKVIFDHSFAKSLFSDTEHDSSPEGYEWEWNPCPGCNATQDDHYVQYCWEHHLQQAVISKDPIDYMYQSVLGGEG